jgi:hypothetical protein
MPYGQQTLRSRGGRYTGRKIFRPYMRPIASHKHPRMSGIPRRGEKSFAPRPVSHPKARALLILIISKQSLALLQIFSKDMEQKFEAMNHGLVSINYRLQSATCRLVSANHRLKSAACRLVSANHRLKSATCRLKSASHRLVSASCRLVSASHRLVSANRRLKSAACRLNPVNHNFNN